MPKVIVAELPLVVTMVVPLFGGLPRFLARLPVRRRGTEVGGLSWFRVDVQGCCIVGARGPILEDLRVGSSHGLCSLSQHPVEWLVGICHVKIKNDDRLLSTRDVPGEDGRACNGEL